MIDFIRGDVRKTLPTVAAKRFQTCITSPPYYGLRDYGHAGQIGLEKSPSEYVASLVSVFREVHRVLKDDGTLWLNLGDSYASAWACSRVNVIGNGSLQNGKRDARPNRLVEGLKEKDLIGIPWRVAFALQADGWYLRQEIIWSKPNPMPESVRDRCTRSHEQIFLFSKAPRYYFDGAAIKEPCAESQAGRVRSDKIGGNKGDDVHHSPGSVYRKGRSGKTAFRGQGLLEGELGTANREGRDMQNIGNGDVRNRRSVWDIATIPYKGAHFATWPPKLVEPMVLAGSRVGDEVLDCFSGSGTTGKVALELGRRAALCELNPDYMTLAEGRTTTTLGLGII